MGNMFPVQLFKTSWIALSSSEPQWERRSEIATSEARFEWKRTSPASLGTLMRRGSSRKEEQRAPEWVRIV